MSKERMSSALNNGRERIELPVTELQQDAVKLGLLMQTAFQSGEFQLQPQQSAEVKDRLANILWCIASLCNETGVSMESVAAHSATQLEARMKDHQFEFEAVVAPQAMVSRQCPSPNGSAAL